MTIMTFIFQGDRQSVCNNNKKKVIILCKQKLKSFMTQNTTTLVL